MNHALLRQQWYWKSSGKLHDESSKTKVLAEISDSHLLHIIGWVKNHPRIYSQEIYDTLIEEAKYRSENYVFIKD